jgi:hypothetical protein
LTPQDRIKELRTRQIYYGSSLVCKLNAVNGYFHYKVYAWLDQLGQDVRITMKQGKYEGQDPEDLFQEVLNELQAKKIKLGVIQHVQ